MKDTEKVTVEKAIVHVLELGRGEPGGDETAPHSVVSNYELALDDLPHVREYLADYVLGVLHDGASAPAKFSEPKGSVRGWAGDLLEHDGDFVDVSKSIAGKLLEAMTRRNGAGTDPSLDQRIKAGSLVVCSFTADKLDYTLLAVLKIDLVQVLVQRIDGQRVTVEFHEDALDPGTDRLQKAAVIRRRRGVPYEVLVLDRQVRHGAARFFSRTFLEARILRTPPGIVGAVGGTVTKVAKDLAAISTPDADEEILFADVGESARKADAVRKWLDDLSKPGEKNLEKSIKELPTEYQGPVQQLVDEGEVPTEFELSEDDAEQLQVEKRRWIGELGVVIEYEQLYRKKVMRTEPVQTDEIYTDEEGNRFPIWKVELHVPGLQWVK